MYLSRLTLLDTPNLNAIIHRLSDGYREHQMLWELFDEDPSAKRDFLFRREMANGRPRYFLLSRRPPVHSLGLWHIDPPKPFRPKLKAGQRLAFMLRANPVVCREGRRHDVVMDAKKRMNWKTLSATDRPPLAQVIRQAGLEWLEKRAPACGFAFDPQGIQVDGYNQWRARRKGGVIRWSTLDFSGLLEVIEPESFRHKLEQGIGPARAFGCGLMLVRRAG